MRMPIEQITLDGYKVQWWRADGVQEVIDLETSRQRDELIAQFDSPGGLLVALYPALADDAQEQLGDPQFMVVACHGFMVVPTSGADTVIH